MLYYAMGDYAAAEPLYRQARDIVRQVLGEQHPNYAASLNNLAVLYQDMGNYAAAEPLLRQALDIRRQALGEQHPDYATSLNNLAVLYDAMGNYAGSEPLYRQASDTWRQALGEQHPDYATSLDNLANLYREMGDYAAAEPLYRQARDIRRQGLGEQHPDYATSVNNLASLYAATGREAEALVLRQEAAVIDDHMLGQVFSIGSERQRMAYLATLQGRLYAFLSLVVQHLPSSHAAVAAAFDLLLRRKAIGAEALAAQRDAVLGGRYPALATQLQELTTWRRQIALKMLAGPAQGEDPQAHQAQLAQWTAHKERLEAELVRQIPEMNLEQLRGADRQAVAQALPPGSALVEFVYCRLFDFKAVPARGQQHWQPAHYLAFVLPAGAPDQVHMLDLGDAANIDRLLAGFRAAITGDDDGSHLARPFRREAAQPALPANDGVDLRRALFDPLVPVLNGCTRLFLAPDGDLTRLPFEALPTGDGRRLIDDYQFSYFSTGRDVLRFGAATSGQPAAPIVAADPDYDLGNEPEPKPAATELKAAEDAMRQGRRSRALDPSALHFAPLPGTEVEGESIGAQLGVQPWLKGAALERRLKTSPAPRILHIATHGFFLEDQPHDPNETQLGLDMAGSTAANSLGRLAHAMENPLLRSGLALAGANTWLSRKQLPEEAEDGLLTAEDVSGLDLLGTELVVLSACDTGLGAVHAGEGVFGLRRAFVLAGAQTLVMSLWKVPDRETQQLMVDFYGRILSGEPRAAALRAAQLAMRHQHPQPKFWAAFICQGEPEPLRNYFSRSITEMHAIT